MRGVFALTLLNVTHILSKISSQDSGNYAVRKFKFCGNISEIYR